MSVLMRLAPAARGLVTDEFRRGDPAAVDVAAYLLPADLDPKREVSLAPLRAVVAAAMERFRGEPWKSDPWLGPRVHATLRLTRREAADRGYFQYLTVAEFPGYVRWRWGNAEVDGDSAPLNRFLGADWVNALSKLWWAAELTRDGDDYSCTERALSISRFTKSWLALNAIHHRAGALAIVDFLIQFGGDGATDSQGERLAKAVNLALRTASLDALADSPPTDTEAIRDWLLQPVDETLMMDALPVGPDEALVPPEAVAAVRRFLDDLAARIDLAAVKSDRRPRPATA